MPSRHVVRISLLILFANIVLASSSWHIRELSNSVWMAWNLTEVKRALPGNSFQIFCSHFGNFISTFSGILCRLTIVFDWSKVIRCSLSLLTILAIFSLILGPLTSSSRSSSFAYNRILSSVLSGSLKLSISDDIFHFVALKRFSQYLPKCSRYSGYQEVPRARRFHIRRAQIVA